MNFYCRGGSVLAVMAVAVSVALAEVPIDIGSRLELMVDDYLIDTLRGGTELRLHRPIAREVAITHDEPPGWEARAPAVRDAGR